MGQIFFPINVEGPEGAKGDGEEALDDIFASEPGPVCEECSKGGILGLVQGFPQASHVDVAKNKKAKISGVVTPKMLTIRHIVRTANLTRLTNPIYYEVKNETVRKYIDLGKAGESPKNRGRPSIIPGAILDANNIHMTRMEDYGYNGKSYKSIMMATIDAMVQGTRFEGSFTTEWFWRRVRHYYLETLLPTAMFDHEDCRAEWLMFKNINQWIDGAKYILLDIRFVKYEPCTFPKK